MKKISVILLSALLLAACNNNENRTPGQQLDTFLKKADTVGGKIGEKAGQVWDSTKLKAKAIGDKVEAEFRKNKIDSSRH